MKIEQLCTSFACALPWWRCDVVLCFTSMRSELFECLCDTCKMKILNNHYHNGKIQYAEQMEARMKIVNNHYHNGKIQHAEQMEARIGVIAWWWKVR